MLKTNSKEVKNRIKKWILDNADGVKEDIEYDKENGNLPDTFNDSDITNICWYIHNDFERVKGWEFGRRMVSKLDLFCDYAAGLPFGNMFIYYYNVSAIDLVGNILDETETERSRFSESEAEFQMTRMIYNFILSALDKSEY